MIKINLFSLTKNELEILDIMWMQKRPLTRTEIIDFSPDRSWSASSIHILLNKLLDKEVIIVDGFIKTGKNYGRTYSPAVSREEYEKTLLKEHFKKGKLSIGEFVASLIADDDIDESAINELDKIIKKRRRKST